MDSGLDHSISRPTTPCSSVYLFGSREDVHRGSRYGSNDSAYRSLNRRASVISGATSDITDAFSEGLDMKLEKNRRKSFNKWPVTYLTSTDLAASGFFFTGYQDRVRCAFCGGILGMWQPGDNPWTEHQKHFPWCNFVKKGYSSDYSSAQSSPTGNNNSTDVCGPFSPLPHIPSRHPCSPYLNDYDARIATFRNWPPNRMQTPEHLAYAGFFYTGKKRWDVFLIGQFDVTKSSLLYETWLYGSLWHIFISPSYLNVTWAASALCLWTYQCFHSIKFPSGNESWFPRDFQCSMT